ncbi:MAG: tRNA (adenosine(37)-N6)-dimethylallyltransferase MiaA [Caulobacteraceae bacterium]|nr:tRNA (adenosine(37)-N6)-dimethylallyltransferase MiaA [Caulobacteraceae bacterium]
MPSPPPVRLIAGPTASGKSAHALDRARAAGGVIINADSMQLYRDLRLLTARPSEAEEAAAEHQLYGVADAADGWSVGRWLRAATALLAELENEGRPAFVVGGTGLYFRALTRGLADVPPVPESVRDDAARQLDSEGEAAFRAALAAVDPAAAARIAPGDRQRLVRAFSVHAATGVALSDWAAATRPVLDPGRWEGVVLEPDREVLYRRCDARLDQMLAAGVLAEVEALAARDLDPNLPAMKATGLRQFLAVVDGRCALEAALEAAKRETRRYAKRQLTWFRNQTPDWPRLPV